MRNYFTDYELKCSCGCNLNNFSKDTLSMLNEAREIAGIPFFINSACRCEKHNKEVGGSAKSSHLKGFAVDIRAKNSVSRFTIVKALQDAGFTRIGIESRFIHVDNDKSKSKNVMWLY